MQAAGQVRPGSELSEAIPKNVITRSLGPNAEVTVDLEGPLPIQPGDTFLLCSDGLSGQVTDEELGALLSVLEPKVAVKVFIDLANLRGGSRQHHRGRRKSAQWQWQCECRQAGSTR